MRIVTQRVTRASVTVDDEVVAAIGPGLMILLGVGPEDDEEKAQYLVHRVSNQRIFGDDEGKMNLSVKDIGGEAIVVSQFTLYADTKKGHRPSYVKAAPPEIASPLVDTFVALMNEAGVPTQSGVFGAHMVLDIVNDGPVTIVMER
ncbi:MAG: D-aminoacyl-tRNA deacylase [Anaerolineae bacterium]|jgi:D-tyrosyl-tRNA(Tyr) deacylase|nr:D-aminoacyl-tRNA deacylase [Anaerolineae bacterium]